MTNTIWSKWIEQLRALPKRSRVRRRMAGTAARGRLAVEALEARDVPAIVTPATGPLTATNNDFTVLQSAIGSAVSGDIIDIQGTFNWSEPNAAAAYGASTATSSSTDIRGVRLPDGVNNLTITSSTNDAHIIGKGDYGTDIFDAFLFANDGPTATGNANLVVQQLNIDDFEAGVVFGWNGTGTFNGTTIRNNTITLGGDDEGTQNIALYVTAGANQQVTGNTFNFQGDGTRTTGSGARSFAFQNTTTGGTGYDGLLIANNVFRLAASSTGVENDYGVWENGHNDDNNSHITISNNQFVGRQGIDDFDRALVLSSQTANLVIDANTFTDVDNVLYEDDFAGPTTGDRFTFSNSVLVRVGGADGVFLHNVSAGGVHVGVNWNIDNTIDGFTGVRGLNELSTQATPTGAATDLGAVTATGPVTLAVVDDSFGTPGRFTDPDGIGTGVGPAAFGFNTFATIQAGIGAVAAGGTVQVAAGAYTGADATAAGKGVALVAGSGTGPVTLTGDLKLDGNDTLSVGVNGPTAGTGYDQLIVNGTVTLNTAALAATGVRAAGPGDVLVLIKNDGTDAVSGTFQGLTEGATVVVNGATYHISYRYNAEAGTADNGNDVALVDVSAPPVTTPPTTTPPVTASLPVHQFAVSGPNGLVSVYNADGSLRAQAAPFGSRAADWRIATGDLNGDGVDDIILAAGSGPLAGLVTGFDGATLASLGSFFPFPGFGGGVAVAIGDVDGNGRADLVLATSAGTSLVQAYDVSTGARLANFVAFPGFAAGVSLAVANLDGIGADEIVTGVASNGPPIVAVYNAAGQLLDAFLAYQFPYSGGINVAAGDVTGTDRKAEILVAPAAGGTSGLVELFSFGSHAPFAAANLSLTGFDTGLRVAINDVDRDGDDDLVFGVGAGGGTRVLAYDLHSQTEVRNFDAYPGFTGGVFVG